MYRDLAHESMEEDPSSTLRTDVARSLLVRICWDDNCALILLSTSRTQADDTTIAPRFNTPCLVSLEDLNTFYSKEGVALPDPSERRIGTDLEHILQSNYVTKTQLTDALLTAGLWVCYIQRKFAFMSTGRSRPAASKHGRS